jgi:subtilisin
VTTWAPPYSNGLGTSWGLKATNVVRDPPNPWTGRGIRVAVLDTGLDFRHADLAARVAAAASFCPGCGVHDSIGHGTHCAGTAVGSTDQRGYRFGIASNAELAAARVFDDTGRTHPAAVLAAIDWALSLGCQVILLSLGAFDGGQSVEFDAAGRRALDAGCLIVAAAGNRRSMGAAQPANTDSIIAVGAVDHWLSVAPFSPWVASNGRCVDIMAPGTHIYSAAIGPGYEIRHGTSMAAAHVAGIAALYAEAEGLRGRALWQRLVAQACPLPSADGESAPHLAIAP